MIRHKKELGMKKNKKEYKFRRLTALWPTADLMDEELIVDLEKQSVTRRNTGHTFILQLTGKNKYYQINYSRNGRVIRLLLHNILFYHKHRYLPEEIDHIDFDPLNNNINNLRGLSLENNRGYRRKLKYVKNKKTSSKYIGVSFCEKLIKLKSGKVWRARVVIPKNHPLYNNSESVELTLGHFQSEDEAGQAYNDKIRELKLEEFRILNDTPQERARKLSLFDNLEPITDLK